MQNAFHFARLGIRAFLKQNNKTSSFKNYFGCISNKSGFSAYFVAVNFLSEIADSDIVSRRYKLRSEDIFLKEDLYATFLTVAVQDCSLFGCFADKCW